ncbi:hippocampus abundant transcript 1 protein-like [Rhopalosiphum maidis]|uniref:hippocampus abundant transcript 1 protein-like n=1 Tax=Rhopalosiphum maidis TaxID=43146 RepID=UPI000EFDD994|nr:hippocampus abundant transcript 1 protein-like [Rhopalosiphum maidis]XP_026822686.1 hippocampus abundant transcript 1 protein-like [Rhopalosiphum maidis]XP_026822687.1 hippocampus abundant transcript 1 protein-like [Rhopalosiphum maidis]
MNGDANNGGPADRLVAAEQPDSGPEKKEPLHRMVLRNMTVEPMLFPYLIASILVILANQNLNIQKACRVELELGTDVCNDLENKDKNSTVLTDSEIAVQKLVADMLIWQTILQSSLPAVFVLFLGSWSDRNRLRRPCMLLPVYGEVVRNLGLLACVYFFDQVPMNATGLWQSLPIAITGYWTVMYMAVFSYVGDHSTDQNKTLKVGLVNATMALCLPIGTGLSGILYRELGFTGVYIIALILCCISIWMAHIFVHDTKQIKFDSGKKHKSSYWTRIKFFFSIIHIIEAFRVTFKKEKNNRRMKVIALTLLITGIMGPLQGDKGVAYLFTRVKFNWNEVQFSVYSTTTMCINLVGTFVTLGVVVRKFGVDDALIGTVATTGKLISQFIFASAATTVVFYSGALVNCLQGPAIISMKSIINKIIPAEELGQVSAVTGIGENVIPIFCGPLYSYVYESTVDFFPSAYFLVTAAITVPTIFLYLWLYLQHRKETKESYEQLPDTDVLKDSNGVATKYGAIKP